MRSPDYRAEQAALDADRQAFGRLREVLDGRRIQLDGASSKMLRIMLGTSDAETVITPDVVTVHFGAQKQRRPCHYYRRLAPGATSELLARAAIDSVTRPLVIGLPADKVPTTGWFPEWSYEAKLVWIVRSDEAVKIAVRASPERWRAPFVGAIPADGPLALRMLAEWAPMAVVQRDFATALACPNCGVPSARYRETSGALVCPSCARSFVHDE